MIHYYTDYSPSITYTSQHLQVHVHVVYNNVTEKEREGGREGEGGREREGGTGGRGREGRREGEGGTEE